jgi:hypothetical protein
MDEFQLAQAKRFLDRFSSRPLSRMLLTDWTDLSGSLTFSQIHEKLHSDAYASLFDFYLDLRLLLEPRDPQQPSSALINVILEDLTHWATRKVMNLPRSKEERDFLRVKKLLEKISVVLSAMVMRPDSAFGDGLPEAVTPASQPFVSPKTPPQAGQKRIEVLQQRIEHLRTPEELQTVLRILQKHIPQFSLAPEVVIEGRYITKACANELRDYLNSVNA